MCIFQPYRITVKRNFMEIQKDTKYTIIKDPEDGTIIVIPDSDIENCRYFDDGECEAFYLLEAEENNGKREMISITNDSILSEDIFKDRPVYIRCSSLDDMLVPCYRYDEIDTIDGEDYYKVHPMDENCKRVKSLSDSNTDVLFDEDYCDGLRSVASDVTFRCLGTCVASGESYYKCSNGKYYHYDGTKELWQQWKELEKLPKGVL